ncbi:MAG: hypothetical protein JWQ07_4095 [Ramlibacter sp.]|nr:hypothetical protein [Ramlibacter sp.]
MRLRIVLHVVSGLLLTVASSVSSAQRVALLIGNAQYASGLPPLTYPLQDTAALDQSLRRIGFDVHQVHNADQRVMTRAIRDFSVKARDAEVAIVYYSGHGMQSRDENFLIPVGAAIASEADLEIEAVPLRGLMRQLEDAAPRTTVVILDACRDNPVAGRTKSGTKGLARVANPPYNTLIVFAAQAGATASDNGVFARELSRHILEPSVGIRAVFDKVGRAVRQVTSQKQIIQRDDQLVEDVVLIANAGAASSEHLALVEQRSWDIASRANTEPAYRAYLTEYPEGRQSAAARVALAGFASATTKVPLPAESAPQPLERRVPFRDGSSGSMRLTGTRASGTYKLGRVTFALPPGDWFMVQMSDTVTGSSAGESNRRPVGRVTGFQVDPTERRISGMVYFMASLISTPNNSSWNNTICELPGSVLRRSVLEGNTMKLPACLVTNWWRLPFERPSDGVGSVLWDWTVENGVTPPRVMVWTRHARYQGSDFLAAVHYVNPEVLGFVSTDDWSEAALDRDADKSDWVNRFTDWGVLMSATAEGTLNGGSPLKAPLPPWPRATK